MTIGFDASRAFKKQRTGTENYSYQLLQAMLQQDHENQYRVYLRNGDGADHFLLQQPNVVPVTINAPRLWTQFGLAKAVAMQQPDVLFIPAHTLPILHRPSLRSVVTIHDLGAEYLPQYHQFPQKLYINKATEYAVKHATKLIAVSEATKHDLIDRLHANAAKISVIYEGYNREHFYPRSPESIAAMLPKYGITKPYILFVGTIQPRKNLVRLVEAFAIALKMIEDEFAGKERELDDLSLILVGKKGWLAETIYAAPEQYGITNRVKFIDYVPDADLPLLYSGCTVFAFPSLFEGFGLPVLEALACGAPVLTSTVSSLPEVGGDAAVLVDPRDPIAIASAIVRLVTNPLARTALELARKNQLEKFTWLKAGAETIALLTAVGK